jgi:hypothetical protein
MSEEKFIEALMILNATGYLTPTTDSDTIAEDYFASLRFNREICRRARYGEQARYLAAPGIGAGVHLSRLELLILHAMASDYDDIADYVVDTLARQNEAIRKENGERASHEEAIDRINALIETVRKDLLPKLERVGAIATASGNPFAIPAIEKAATDPMLLQALENGGPIQAVG